jgi:hypothetical protein
VAQDGLTGSGLGRDEIEEARRGGVVARVLPLQEDNDVLVVGLVFIDAPPAALLQDIRSTGMLRSNGRVLQSGRFSAPPMPQDLDPLTFAPQDLEDLRKCRVGDCDIRVDAATMATAGELHWGTPDASIKASMALKHALWIQLQSYREQGAAGMAVYRENRVPDESGRELTKLLDGSPRPFPESPSFLEYLKEYPRVRLPDVESFFCWSKEAQRKPVVRLVHVSLRTVNTEGGPHHLVALVHVHDNHFYLAYAEFLRLIPERGAATGFYLVRWIRARIDPPRRLRGLLLGRIKEQMREAMKSDIESVRDGLARQ